MCEMKLLKNSFEHAINIIQHVVVPKADDVIPTLFQRGRPFAVRLSSFAMLATVDLNDQFSFERNEVDDISGERNCRLNLTPSSWRARSLEHRNFSASVDR